MINSVTNNHNLVAWNNRNVFCPRSGGQKSKVSPAQRLGLESWLPLSLSFLLLFTCEPESVVLYLWNSEFYQD